MVVVFYAAPRKAHTDRVRKLIGILIKIFQIKRNKIKKKIEHKINKYGYKILYKKSKEEYICEAKILRTVISYLDYFILWIKKFF